MSDISQGKTIADLLSRLEKAEHLLEVRQGVINDMLEDEEGYLTKIRKAEAECERLRKFHAEDMRVTNESADYHMKLCQKQREQLAEADWLINAQRDRHSQAVDLEQRRDKWIEGRKLGST